MIIINVYAPFLLVSEMKFEMNFLLIIASMRFTVIKKKLKFIAGVDKFMHMFEQSNFMKFPIS